MHGVSARTVWAHHVLSVGLHELLLADVAHVARGDRRLDPGREPSGGGRAGAKRRVEELTRGGSGSARRVVVFPRPRRRGDEMRGENQGAFGEPRRGGGGPVERDRPGLGWAVGSGIGGRRKRGSRALLRAVGAAAAGGR